LVSGILTRSPQNLLPMPPASAQGQDALGLEPVIAALAIALQSFAVGVGEYLRDLIRWFRVADVMIAFATWAMIGQLLSAPPGADGGVRDSRLTAFFRRLSAIQRHRLIFGIVLLVSAYLSIAAIVAIPWLQQRAAAEPANKEQLKAALDSLILSQPEFDKQFPADVRSTSDVFVSLDKTLNEVDEEVKRLKQQPNRDQAVNYLTDKLTLVRSLESTARSQLEGATRDLESLRNSTRQYEKDAEQTAIGAFETDTLSPMSTQERAVYRQTLEQWFRERISESHRGLRHCIESTRGWASGVQDWAERNSGELRADIDLVRGPQGTPPVLRDWRSNPRSFQSVFSGPRSSPSDCTSPSLDLTRPAPPDPGLGLGPFGFVSSWLLRTRSLALALITGMLGFGLLGAAISSFVQKGPSAGSDPQEGSTVMPGASDLGVVVIRGMTAAVIIFLGVKGGLAAYAVGETEPNAYVLFFTCLVGAAFSERVWNWARVKLEGQLQNNDAKAPAASDVADNKKKDAQLQGNNPVAETPPELPPKKI
jgi:hypothetical protein